MLDKVTTTRSDRLVQAGGALCGLGLFTTLAVAAAVELDITSLGAWQVVFPAALVAGGVLVVLGDRSRGSRDVDADGPTLEELASDD